MDLLSTELSRWSLAAWFLFLGAAVGSFLNVVAYRLPAGLNIAWPGSHCPACKHAIRWYDNIPVLGWLWLGGRCRDCRGPISIRYPLIEAAGAAMFLLVMNVEVLHGGAKSASELLSLCFLHLALLSTLFAAALIAWDGKPKVAGTLRVPSAPSCKTLSADGTRRVPTILCLAIFSGLVLGWRVEAALLLIALFLAIACSRFSKRWPLAARLSTIVWLMPLTLVWILDRAWIVTHLHL